MSARFTVGLLIFAATAGSFQANAFINCAANPFQPACCPAPCPVIDGARLVEETASARNERAKARLVDVTNQVVDIVKGQYGTGVPAATAVALGLPAHFVNEPLVAAAWQAVATSSGAASTQEAVVRLIVSEALARFHRLEVINTRSGAAYPAWITTVAGAAASSVWGQMDTARRIDLTATTATSLGADIRAQGLARAAVTADPPPQTSTAGGQTAGDARPTAGVADLVGTLDALGRDLARQIDRNNLRAANIRNADRISYLRETLASYDEAVRYEATQSTLLRGQVALAFLNPLEGAIASQRLLKENDRTTYIDSWEKERAAAAAGSALYDVITSNPERLSPPSGLPFCSDPQDDRPRPMQSCRDRLVEAAANWLEARKYQEWLKPFRDSAASWEARLTGRIKTSNDATDGVLAARDPAASQRASAQQLLGAVGSAAARFGRHPKLAEFQQVAALLAAQANEPKVIAYAP